MRVICYDRSVCYDRSDPKAPTTEMRRILRRTMLLISEKAKLPGRAASLGQQPVDLRRDSPGQHPPWSTSWSPLPNLHMTRSSPARGSPGRPVLSTGTVTGTNTIFFQDVLIRPPARVRGGWPVLQRSRLFGGAAAIRIRPERSGVQRFGGPEALLP